MHMHSISTKLATDYAARTVKAWHAATDTVEAYKSCEETEDGIEIVNVSLSVNGEFFGTMTVYALADGTLYGEV